MVLDEESGEYKPRHGMGRIGEDKKGPWLMLHSNGKGDDFDPYADRLDSKKAQKAKQKMQEDRNIQEAHAAGYKAPLTISGKLAAESRNLERTSAKSHMGKALEAAQRSTASMGKFDRRVEDEPDIKAPRGKRRKLESSVHADLAGEKGRSLKMLDKMVGSSANAKFN